MDKTEAIARTQSLLTEARRKYFETQPPAREAYYEGRASAFSEAITIMKEVETAPEELQGRAVRIIGKLGFAEEDVSLLLNITIEKQRELRDVNE